MTRFLDILNPLKGGEAPSSPNNNKLDEDNDEQSSEAQSAPKLELSSSSQEEDTTKKPTNSLEEQEKEFGEDTTMHLAAPSEIESKNLKHGKPPIITTKEEDHDSGTTSSTSLNGDKSAAPAIVHMESDESEEGISIHDNIPVKDETHEVSQPQSEQSKQDGEDFKSPALRWYNPIRRFCGRIVNDVMFQIVIVILIVMNAVMMGIGTYDFVEDNPKVQKAFELADLTFLIIFTIESALQIGYHGYQLFQDGWLTFDLLVVVLSWTLDTVQIFRAMRVFRAFRLVARLEVLKDLVNAIVAVLPRIGSIMLLFCLVLYIYAVLCTVLYGMDRYGDDNLDYFGRLDYSLFTLFQFVTLDNWGEITREVKSIHSSATYVILSFLTVSSFILYSLVVAVVCDAVAVVEHPDIALRNFEDQMKKEKSKTKKRVSKLTSHLDDLSQQQMEILTSVQQRLMKYSNFRDDDARDSQLQIAELELYDG